MKIIHRYDGIDSQESDNDNDLKPKKHGERKENENDLDTDEHLERKEDLIVLEKKKDLDEEKDLQSKHHGHGQQTLLSVPGKEKVSDMKNNDQQTKTQSDAGKEIQSATNGFTKPCNEKAPETKASCQLDFKLPKTASQEFPIRVPILKNGHKSRHGKEFIITTQTCAFDTIVSSFATMYLQFSHVREQIDSSGSKISELIKSLFSRTSSSHCSDFKETYANRNIILKELYLGWCKSSNFRKNNDTTYIDCTTGIGGLFARMCLKLDQNFVSGVQEKNCRKCKTVHTKHLTFLKTTRKVINLAKINDYVDRNLPEKCYTCNSQCEISMSYNNIVVLETEPATVKRNQKIALENVCPTLDIDKTLYRLCAVMHYQIELNHFVSYTRQSDNSWRCADDLRKSEQKVDASTVTNPFILCYVATVPRIDFTNLTEVKVN